MLAGALALPASALGAVQLGAYTPGAPGDAGALASYAQMVGRPPDIVMWFREFGDPLLNPAEAENLRAGGQTPMITWEPNSASLAQLAAGGYDAYLHESAAIAREWGRPLMIRFAHEMNGNWYSWGALPPDLYTAAWRHVVAIFRADGAGNVSWVWSPYVELGGKYPVAPYFPGDQWVDYVGLDGYNWGSARGRWQSLEAIFAGTYLTVSSLSVRPIILAEVASGESDGDKGAWIRSGFMSTIPRLFPRVSAVVWFNQAREVDWRVDSSAGSLEAFRSVVRCSLYGGTGPCEAPPEGQPSSRPHLCALRVTPRFAHAAVASISFCLSEPAVVRIVIRRRGRRRARARTLRVGRSGRRRVSLARIVGARNLRAGRYRLTLVARNRMGRSVRRSAHFRVVEPTPPSIGAGWRLGT